jgi:hypothetical protein
VPNPIELAMNISNSGESLLEKDEYCRECGGHSVTNRLHKLGFVPADVAHIVAEPCQTLTKKKKN